MIVGLLAMLFMLVTAFIMLARFDRQTLQMTGRADQVTHIVDAINDMTAAAIRGARGGDLVSGAAYVDIPGAGNPNDPNWGSPWLASGEPVRNPNGGYYPIDYSYPAVSGLSGALDPTDANVPLTQTMVDADGGGMRVEPGNPGSPGSLTQDTIYNARQPMSDADADGMPDSLFGSVGALTELANAMGGRSVHATGIDTSYLTNSPTDPNYANFLAWQQYDSTARYAVAAKIVSHGGMVQVSAPTNQVMWNSAFTGAMFNWVENPIDVQQGAAALAPDFIQADRDQLLAMFAQRGAVEAALRRRGGLLAGNGATWSAGQAAQADIPPALWTLQSRFLRTFAPANWQRFNLASLDDPSGWNAWRAAAAIDATLYNDGVYLGDTTPARAYYAQRQLLTTVNNSDELARIEDPNAVPGFQPGKLKFYLGQITDLATGAFDGDGHYEQTRGPAIVAKLASYFEEMLQGYGDWYIADGSAEEVVKRRQQAYMLAVNTVAFAAPRDPTGSATAGFIDNVWCVDAANPADEKMYVGYAPQPFITQVIAYKKVDLSDPENPLQPIALAMELYNPNEPKAVGGVDEQALRLQQFALSLNDVYEGSGFDPQYLAVLTDGGPFLGQGFTDRMEGRAFLPVIVNDSTSNTYFESNWPVLPYVGPLFAGLPVSAVSSKITVKLWRQGTSLGGSLSPWVLVDQFEIPEPANLSGEPTEWDGSFVDAWRDTNTELYWGQYAGGIAARWRCAVAFAPDKPGGGTETAYHKREVSDGKPDQDTDENGQPLNRLTFLGMPGPGLDAPFQPCVPLYTMNADRVTTTLHGVARPASFPTVGFALFVPRFSHDGGWVGETWAAPRAASSALYEDWSNKGHDVTSYPADFGHMPIFDNKQANNASVGGFDKTGTVPWGLLVFDYLTTLNPDDGDGDGVPWQFDPGDGPVDEYRVPGRVNINDASWYVLAGVPVIGPVDAANMAASDLPCGYVDRAAGVALTGASPAFWSEAAGILAGQNVAGTVYRYPTYGPAVAEPLIDRSGAMNGQWYRLGPYLAQAGASYRDRLPYEVANLGTAYGRNSPNLPQYRPLVYGSDQAGGIRGGMPGSAARGFLSLGELANVIAFDGSTIADLSGGAGATVLGGYGMATGGDFTKAVSLLALLDTHFLTTRSNTFTVYTTLFDREDPQASTSSQVTLDRSNLLPRLIWQDTNGNGFQDPPPTDTYTTLQSDGPPELIARHDYSYFNAQYDQ